MRNLERQLSIVICGICACVPFFLLLTSCSGTAEKPEDISTQKVTAAQQLDTSDPISVARAFFTALAQKDADRALEQVLPEQRSAFKKQLERGFPPIPAAMQLETESIVEKQEAQVEMRNADFGLDLIYKDGRWWVTE